MARRRPRSAGADEGAGPVPAEGEAVGLETMENEPAQTEPAQEELPGREVISDEPTSEEIARRAYDRYQQRGGTHGFDQEDWYEAEREVRGSRSRKDE